MSDTETFDGISAEEAADIINDFDWLRDRAIRAAGGYMRNAEFATLRIDGADVIVTTTYACSDYDGYCDETEEARAPLAWVIASDAEFERRLAEKKAEQDRALNAQRLRQAEMILQRQQRAQYEALKKIYEGV